MRAIYCVAVLVLAGCPSSAPVGAPALRGKLQLTVDPDRPLVRGETVLLHAAVNNGSAVAGAGVVTFTLEPGLVVGAEPLRVEGPLAIGGRLETMLSVVVPDDDQVRRIDISARVSAADGQIATVVKTVEVNANGRLHTDTQSHPSMSGRLTAALDASSRLKRGSNVTLTLTATSTQAHPRFELLFLLPPEATVIGGVAALGPLSVAAGESHTLTATVHVADAATDSLVVRGVARYGRPGDSDHAGGAILSLEDNP
jgi:hypothetical protein